MRVGRRARWALAGIGVVVPVAVGVAVNRVEGPWWQQMLSFAVAALLGWVGQWAARRTPSSGGRPVGSGPTVPVTVQLAASISDRPGHIEGPLVVGELPREPAGFQTRPELMGKLEEAARSGRPAVVSALAGARGVGKTQLAAAYARQCAEQGWPLVAWVNAETRDQVLVGLDGVAEAVGVRVEGEDSTVTANRVRDWLSGQNQRCLVVFDNLVEVDAVEPWLPAVGQAQIVISTTQLAVRALGRLVPVDVFTPDETVAFLDERTGRDDEQGAKLLAEEVGRLPLALSQASWVIAQQGMGYEDYVGRLRALAVEQELRPVRGEHYPHGAAEAVLLSLKQLGPGRRVRVERALLDLLAVLSPTGVPREWLYMAIRDGLLGRFGHDGSDVAGRVNAAIGKLAESSLITLSVDGSTIRSHSFIQRVLRDSARMREDLDRILASATQLVEANAVQLRRVAFDRSQMEIFVQQVTALWLNVDHPASASPDGVVYRALRLRNRAGQCLQEAGDLSRATSLFEQNLCDRERVLGPDHPDTLTSRNNVACAYESVGRLDDAIRLFKQNLTDRERVLGPDHPDSLASRNNLAGGYRSAGRLDEAISLLEQNLTDYERVLGPDHPHTLTSRNNVARAYESAGRLDDAIPLFEQNLTDLERVLGHDHPHSLVSRDKLASAYHSAGRFAEAIFLYEQNLTECVRVLGADHSVTNTVREHLAEARGSVGRG